MEDLSCTGKPVAEEVKPMLAVEIDILNSKIIDIREYLFKIQEIYISQKNLPLLSDEKRYQST